MKRERPLSPRRAAEFRGRRLRRWFGTSKERAERFTKLVRLHGYDYAVTVSARSERSVLTHDRSSLA